jgi:hypothetical protein
LGRKWGKGK